MILYYLVKRFEKQARENHLWNITPKSLQTILTLLYYNTSEQTQEFLSRIWKSIPNIPEIVKNIEMLSVFKVAFPVLEKALGNDPNAFAFFREGVRVVTVMQYIKDGDEFGGSKIKYNDLHLASTSVSFTFKGAPLIHKWSQVGLSEGSLSKTSSFMIYASDVGARFFAIAAESKNDPTQKNLDVLKANMKLSTLCLAFAGGLTRSYVSKILGEKVAAIGIHDKMKKLANELEFSLFKFITGDNTTSFSDKEDVISKSNKYFFALEDSSFKYPVWAASTVTNFLIETETRTVAELLTIFQPMTLVRMTAPIFENQVLNMFGSDMAVEVTNYEYVFEAIILGSMAYDSFNYVASTLGNTTEVNVEL